MRGRDIVKDIMEKTNVSNATLAHRLGTSIATMWDRINSKKVKDIPLSTLNEMLRALDYKVLIVPANRQVKNDEYTVTSGDAETEQ